ncbi:MAG: GTPase Era [Candidatus Kryptonium sp.]
MQDNEKKIEEIKREIPSDFKAGYVAIVGEPNVGKSTLLNTLLQHKISIVTPKPQTTRHKIIGIMTGENYQIVFLDTPGLIKPRYLLQEVMMEYAESALKDADIVLFMVDVKKVKTNDAIVKTLPFEILKKYVEEKPIILVINKVDLINKLEVLPIIDFFSKVFPFKEIVPISALKGQNIDELKKVLIQYLPTHPPFYPPDMITEHPERFFVAEIIREKIFQLCRQEIPYSTTVSIVEFKEAQNEGERDYISAEIYVEKESQKGIIIGKDGQMLKKIGTLAREEIEWFLGRPVYLELYVKARKKWRDSKVWLKRLGYTVD